MAGCCPDHARTRRGLAGGRSSRTCAPSVLAGTPRGDSAIRRRRVHMSRDDEMRAAEEAEDFGESSAKNAARDASSGADEMSLIHLAASATEVLEAERRHNELPSGACPPDRQTFLVRLPLKIETRGREEEVRQCVAAEVEQSCLRAAYAVAGILVRAAVVDCARLEVSHLRVRAQVRDDLVQKRRQSAVICYLSASPGHGGCGWSGSNHSGRVGHGVSVGTRPGAGL
jgi:hypothetical protein